MGGRTAVSGFTVIFLACILGSLDEVKADPVPDPSHPHHYDICTYILQRHHHHHDEETTTPAPTTTTPAEDTTKKARKHKFDWFGNLLKQLVDLENEEDTKTDEDKKKEEEKKKKEEEEKKKKEEEEKKKKEEEEKKKKEESRGFKSFDEFFEVYINILSKMYYSI